MNLKTVKKLNNSLLIGIYLCFLLMIPLIAVSGYSEEINEQTLELISATLLGEGSNDFVHDIAVGVSGNVYLMGVTHSQNFPTTPGVYDETYNGGWDVFIQKRSTDGATVIWSTLFGGSADDGNVGHKYSGKMVLDGSDNIIITGRTKSSDFPIKDANNFNHSGGWDGFVAKLSSDGTTLHWSTYLGGNDTDIIRSVTTDLLGDVYATGETCSTDFPVKNGFDNTLGGNFDAFIAKFSGEDSELLWSSFLGGNQYDIGNDIEVDKFNNLYVVGTTNSADFPVKSAFDDSLGGGFDVFATKFAPDGSEIEFSTFLGGQQNDEAMALAVDSLRNIYLTGTTSSDDFPVSVNAFQSSYVGGGPLITWNREGSSTSYDTWHIGDSFITKLTASGTSLEWSTYLGDSAQDLGWDIALDNETNVYTVGMTLSESFPLKNHLYNYTPSDRNCYISSLSKDGDSLLWSTYISGRGTDVPSGLVVDSHSNLVYFCGDTRSSDFPEINDYIKGGFDGFVAVLKYLPPPVTYSITSSITSPITTVQKSSFDMVAMLIAISAMVIIVRKRRKYLPK